MGLYLYIRKQSEELVCSLWTLSWFHGFSSAFHTITSNSALEIKELMHEFQSTPPEEKNELKLPEDFLSPFPFSNWMERENELEVRRLLFFAP